MRTNLILLFFGKSTGGGGGGQHSSGAIQFRPSVKTITHFPNWREKREKRDGIAIDFVIWESRSSRFSFCGLRS